jgi:glycerophosphodiester phosphodiesterase
MFITNAGKVPMTDLELRAASLQMAVQFARCWDLAGVVFACEALLYCPRFVRFVKNAGLVCASYGLLNNDPINARVSFSFFPLLRFSMLKLFFEMMITLLARNKRMPAWILL